MTGSRSGTGVSASVHVRTSTLASSTGSASSLPVRRSAAGTFSRATASMASVASTPMTSWPRRASSAAWRPVPQAAVERDADGQVGEQRVHDRLLAPDGGVGTVVLLRPARVAGLDVVLGERERERVRELVEAVHDEADLVHAAAAPTPGRAAQCAASPAPRPRGRTPPPAARCRAVRWPVWSLASLSSLIAPFSSEHGSMRLRISGAIDPCSVGGAGGRVA